MKKTITLTAAALLASSLLLAGCSDDSDDAASPSGTPTASATPAADATTAAPTDVDVISQTNLTLDAAQGTFDLLGLKTEIVDKDGKPVTPGKDASAWLVVSQDPETGNVPVGSTVKLVVAKA